MVSRTAVALGFAVVASSAQAEMFGNGYTLTLAGGSTVRANSTDHDTYRGEVNFRWLPEIWGTDDWNLSLNHAFSIMTFRDVNNVNAISWAPNIIFTTRKSEGFRPYFQFGFGFAYFDDDELRSKPKPHPRWTREGRTDLGSHGLFESSVGIGLMRDDLSIRAKFYHYSNANMSNNNEGIDVAEFGISYQF